MSWLKSATRKPLGVQTEKKMRAHDIICIHTMVGYLASTDDMFKQNGYTGTESHFGIGGRWGSDARRELDGVIYQWQDTDYEADANLDGAPRVLSIETADNAPSLPREIQPWTPKQVESIVNLIAVLCLLYDIPPVLIPDTKPGRRGLGYHAQGIAPNRVTGGEVWSVSRGKECPGPVRIQQFKTVIVPAVAQRLRELKEKYDVLNDKDREWLNTQGPKWAKAAVVDWADDLNIPNKVLNPGDVQGANWSFTGWAAAQDQKADRANDKQNATDAKVESLTASLAKLETQNGLLKMMLEELLLRIPAAK
jgi:hypothetical protein